MFEACDLFFVQQGKQMRHHLKKSGLVVVGREGCAGALNTTAARQPCRCRSQKSPLRWGPRFIAGIGCGELISAAVFDDGELESAAAAGPSGLLLLVVLRPADDGRCRLTSGGCSSRAPPCGRQGAL